MSINAEFEEDVDAPCDIQPLVNSESGCISSAKPANVRDVTHLHLLSRQIPRFHPKTSAMTPSILSPRGKNP